MSQAQLGRAQDVVDTTAKYYDSDDADRFYFAVWGGEDIHIGIYETPGESIREASRRTVHRLAQVIEIGEGDRVLDLGAGYGGAARYLASSRGAKVTCFNLSRAQNERNIELTAQAGLGDCVRVREGNFESLPFEDGSFDVVWSQDSFLHSERRSQVLAEAFRVLRPGGSLVFTDPMQADDCPSDVLGPVLTRIHLQSLGSFAFYRAAARELGFVEREVQDLSTFLPRHYGRVREELEARKGELCATVSEAYVERMLEGLRRWVEAGEAGHLAWGILAFTKPEAL